MLLQIKLNLIRVLQIKKPNFQFKKIKFVKDIFSCQDLIKHLKNHTFLNYQEISIY